MKIHKRKEGKKTVLHCGEDKTHTYTDNWGKVTCERCLRSKKETKKETIIDKIKKAFQKIIKKEK